MHRLLVAPRQATRNARSRQLPILRWLLLAVFGMASTAFGDTPEQHWQAAQQAIAQRNYSEAEKHLSAVLASDKKPPAAVHYLRGRVRFRLGKVRQSVEDFDAYVKREPKLASRQWERGIACYYARQFKKGAAQFKLYQTYHDNDVENSVWRFLCQARYEGVKKARADVLPIKNDRRVPMMEIYRLFRGESTPAKVMAAVEAGEPSAGERDYRMFYARLYLGLYYEAHGQSKRAREQIFLAADKHRQTRGINNYMWAVADIHAKQLRKKPRGKTPPPPAKPGKPAAAPPKKPPAKSSRNDNSCAPRAARSTP